MWREAVGGKGALFTKNEAQNNGFQCVVCVCVCVCVTGQHISTKVL